MKIIVCVKQVPGTSNVVIDPETGVLKRDGVESKLNPFDLYAIEQALRLRKLHGGSVTTISMGPPQARAALLETIYMGIDQGFLISDRRLAGADVLATSRTLAQGIAATGPFDLILCGKQTTDGDTAQVGPEISEFLEISCASNVTEICSVENGLVTVKINLDHCVQKQCMALPCLISVDREINTPRLPSLKRKLALEKDKIKVLTLDNFADRDEKHYGLIASPTQVCKIFPPEKNTIKELYQGEHPDAALFGLLVEKKFI